MHVQGREQHLLLCVGECIGILMVNYEFAIFVIALVLQPSRLVCQKYVRKRKGAVKTRMTVLKMCIYL